MSTPVARTDKDRIGNDRTGPARSSWSRVVAPMFVIVFLVRVLGPNWRQGFTPSFPDTFSFLDSARIGPLWPSFWFGDRPVGLPLVAWLLGRDVRAIVLVQTVSYTLAAVTLAAATVRLATNRIVGWVTAVVVVGFTCQPRFALWSLEVLSESLGLTLSLVTLAAWLSFADRPSQRRLVLAFAATVALLVTRDAHAVTVAFIAVGALVASAFARDHRRALRVGAAILVVAVAYVAVAQSTSERNRYPLINNVGLRVLPDSELASRWTARGMPTDSALLARAGSDSWSDGEAFLRDPDLADFRAWVDGEGQRDQIASLALDAGSWTSKFADDLPSLLSYDFHDYDRYGLSDRLPHRPWGLDLPTSSAGVLAWFVVGLGAVGIVARRRRRVAAVLAVGLVATAVEAYTSYALDAVEVQRHMVGVFLRFAVLTTLAVGLAVGELVRGRSDTSMRERPDRTTAVSAAVAIGVTGIAWMAVEHRSQDYDPQFARTVVERTARFGGTFYQNGIHNKGPFEMVVYDAARWLTSYGSYWFAISAFVIFAAVAIGSAGAKIVRTLGAGPNVALAVGAVALTHFTLSSADYAGVLYSRNITTAILASVIVIVLSERPWRTQRSALVSWIGVASLIGLAMQTLITTVFAACGVTLIAFAVRRRHVRRPFVTFAASASGVVVSAPVWYLMRGSFDEFWSGWWTYAGFMNSGLGRSWRDQWGLGWHTFLGYHQERPMLVLLLTAFVISARRPGLSPRERAVAAGIAVWWAGGWIELVLSQRYSSHYFSVIAVPMFAMSAFVIGDLARSLPDLRVLRRRALPVVALLSVVVLQGSDLFWNGVESAGRFTGFGALAAEREQARSGESRTVRAVLDLVSRDGDPLLAWTMYPWTYLDNHRVPATRFAWKSFLIGEIYLGRTSPAYILPRTDEWFADDLAESSPQAYLHPLSVSTNGNEKFIARVERDFTPVYASDDDEIWLTKSAWNRLTAPASGPTRVVDLSSEPVVLADDDCRSIDATIDDLSDESRVTFWLRDTDGSTEDVALSLSRRRAWSSSGTVEFSSTDLDESGPMRLRLLVGSRSAALVLDGSIVAAVRIDGSTTVTAESTDGSRLGDVRTATMPESAGC